MTYHLAGSHMPWFEHLTDSVRALGKAAEEWQLADRAASLIQDRVQMGRTVVHGGRTDDRIGPDSLPVYRRTRSRRPHVQAVRQLQHLYTEHRGHTRYGYGHAAMLFASGAAWAIAEVQAGRRPGRVVFGLDECRPPEPVPHPYGVEGLDGYARAGKVREEYERLLRMDHARQYAEEIAGRDDHEVSERDANDMFEAAETARGIEDAAYAYGLALERAVQFVLIAPREQYRKQLAEERAAEAEDGQG